MTWAEQLREEGRTQERKRAEEALQRAEEEHARAEELLSKTRQQTIVLLKMRFGELPDTALRAIADATEEQLFAWQITTDLTDLTR